MVLGEVDGHPTACWAPVWKGGTQADSAGTGGLTAVQWPRASPATDQRRVVATLTNW